MSFLFNDFETFISTTGFKALNALSFRHYGSQWGIYQKNIFSTDKILTSSHVYSVDTLQQYNVTTAPQEEGSFSSVNKVAQPRQHTITLLCDGSSDGIIGSLLPSYLDDESGTRGSFLNALDSLVSDTNLYQIRVPERTYNNVNMIGYSCNRSSESGVTLLTVELTFQEIRQTKSSGWVNVSLPWQSKSSNQGSVQVQK